MRGRAFGAHERGYEGATNEWMTPPWLIKALGEFDLDPCAPVAAPFRAARQSWSIDEDGLKRDWHGRVWLNPPYGPHAARWVAKLAEHGSGTALLFARTETRMWFEWVWPKARALLFLKGRLNFYRPDGNPGPQNAGAPSVLVAYSQHDADQFRLAGLQGWYVDLWPGYSAEDVLRERMTTCE